MASGPNCLPTVCSSAHGFLGTWMLSILPLSCELCTLHEKQCLSPAYASDSLCMEMDTLAHGLVPPNPHWDL